MDYIEKLAYVMEDHEGDHKDEKELIEFLVCKCYFYQKQHELAISTLNQISIELKSLSYSLLKTDKDGYNH